MKKATIRFTALLIIVIAYQLTISSAIAQAPEKMSYQSVIRNASGVLVKSLPVGIRISILQTTSTGTAVFVETHSKTTNANGLASLEIGMGTPVTGAFAAIDWAAGPYFIKTETDPLGGTTYTITGTSQLMSVPYAMYAKAAGNSLWTVSGNNIFNANSGNVGIGTTTPTAKLDVAEGGPNLSIVIGANNSGGTTRTTNTIKVGRFGSYHYDNSQAPFALIASASDVATNTISIGGGSWVMNAATDVRFYTASNTVTTLGTERMRIDASGNVGIGTATPTQRMESCYSSSALTINYLASNLNSGSPVAVYGFEVTGSAESRAVKAGIGFERTDYQGRGVMHFYLNSANDATNISGSKLSPGNIKMTIDQSGNVGIGTTTPSYKLQVNGTAAGTSWTNTSDKRLKKNIQPITEALDKVLALNGITFYWDKTLNPDMNTDDKKHLGFLAQDIEKVLPQVVNTADDKLQTKSVAYSEVIPVLVEAIKEQQKQIEELRYQIKKLQDEK